MATPIQQMKDRFGDKAKLVAAVKKLAVADLWLDRVNAVKGLERASNAKLLRLHDVLERAKKEFGTRAKLIDTILEVQKRSKDAGYRSRLEGYPVARLLDLHGSASRAKAPEAAAAKPAKKAKKPRSKKAKAKLRA